MSRKLGIWSFLFAFVAVCRAGIFRALDASVYIGGWPNQPNVIGSEITVVSDPSILPVSNPEPQILEGMTIFKIVLQGDPGVFPGVNIMVPSSVNMMAAQKFTGFILLTNPADAIEGICFVKFQDKDWGRTPTRFYPSGTTSASLNTNTWTKFEVDFPSYWPEEKARQQNVAADSQLVDDPNTVMITLGSQSVTMYFAGYIGDLTAYEPPYIPTRYVDPPIPAFPEGVEIEFWTKDQTPIPPDRGLDIQWSCQSNPANTRLRHYRDLKEVAIRAYRDTNIGPWPMNANANVQWVNAGAESGYTIQPLWAGNFPVNFPGRIVPSPYLACVAHNADFYIIGNNTGKATKTLVVWSPTEGADTQFLVGGYADWVKSLQDGNGEDTVAVHLRLRVPNWIEKFGENFRWINTIKPNCTEGAYYWLCPDHIYMKDHQFGVLKTSKEWLLPLTNWTTDYFKANGYDITLDLEQVPQSLATISGELYAVPISVTMFPWVVNEDSINAIGEMLPPPYGQWGTAWWTKWNMDKWKSYMKKIYDKGPEYRNLLSIPVGTETEFAAYTFFHYGATLLNAAGRCGLDKFAERALEETVGFWKNNDQMIYPRFINDDGKDRWEQWIQTAPLEDPLQEPNFYFKDPQWINVNTPYKGFDITYGAGRPGMRKCYPPTGVSKARSVLVGLSKFSRDPDFAFDALMTAIARNTRLHVNTPERNPSDQGEGVTAFRSTKFEPEYMESLAADPAGTDQANKRFWYNLLEHAVYAGYPVPYLSSFADIADRNPMNLVYNEMLYKNVNASEAVKRACRIINYATRPPCDERYWKTTLLRDSTNNKVTVNYTYVDNYSNLCRTQLALAKVPPSAVKDYTTSNIIAIDSSVSKAMVGISAFGVVIDVILAALFVYKRKERVIRAAAFAPSMMIFLGAWFTLTSVIMRTSNSGKLGWIQCFGTYWFFAIGFGLVLGSLTVKSYRVDRIFRNKSPGFRFPDLWVMLMIMCILAGEIFFLLIFQFWIANDKEVSIVTLPNTAVALEQPECKISASGAVGLLYFYNALLIVAAATCAIRTRNVLSTFNENTFTAAAIGLITVITVVIVPVLNLISSLQAVFLLVGLGTFLATVLSVIIFAVPKLLMAFGVMRETSNPAANTGIDTSSPEVTNQKRTQVLPSATVTKTSRDVSQSSRSGGHHV